MPGVQVLQSGPFDVTPCLHTQTGTIQDAAPILLIGVPFTDGSLQHEWYTHWSVPRHGTQSMNVRWFLFFDVIGQLSSILLNDWIYWLLHSLIDTFQLRFSWVDDYDIVGGCREVQMERHHQEITGGSAVERRLQDSAGSTQTLWPQGPHLVLYYSMCPTFHPSLQLWRFHFNVQFANFLIVSLADNRSIQTISLLLSNYSQTGKLVFTFIMTLCKAYLIQKPIVTLLQV